MDLKQVDLSFRVFDIIDSIVVRHGSRKFEQEEQEVQNAVQEPQIIKIGVLGNRRSMIYNT